MSQQPFPVLHAPVVDPQTGIITVAWQKLLSTLWQRTGGINAGGVILALTPGASPWTYTLPANGMLQIAGGTVSAVSFNRGGTAIPLPTAGMWYGMLGDQFQVTYSHAPTGNFVPT